MTTVEKQKRKRRFGDRNDGRLLRSLSPMMKLMPYIMPQRCDACNSFRGYVCLLYTSKQVRHEVKPPLYRLKPPWIAGALVTMQ